MADNRLTNMEVCEDDGSTSHHSLPPAEEKHEQRSFSGPVYEFTWGELVFGVVSVVIFFFDFGTDINIVLQYFLQKQILYGSVSLLFTAGPSLVACGLSLQWYILDYKTAQTLKHEPSNVLWVVRFAMTVLQFGPVIRMIECLYIGYKYKKASSSQRKSRYSKMLLWESTDACLLRLIESFLESAPQLTWQIYITMTIRPEEDVVLFSTRVFTILTSWMSLMISVALTLTSYHRLLRLSRNDSHNMPKKAMPFYFLWRTTEIGNRVLCICLFASTFHAIVFIPLGIHWVAMTVWAICQKTTFYLNRCHETIFNVVCGYILIFCFLNLRDGHTRLRYIFYYILFYAENFTMLAVWFSYPSQPGFGKGFHVGGLVVVVLLAGLHICFQLLIYFCCHPTGKIELCLPCSRDDCFEMLCHNLEKDECKHQETLTESQDGEGSLATNSVNVDDGLAFMP